MDFFNKLGDSIQSVGKEVTKKTKDLSGTVSLNAQIKESENQLSQVYRIIGEKYYNLCKEEAKSRYPEETDEIVKIQNKLAEDREKLRNLKGLKLCSNCGAEIEKGVLHCPMCGTEQQRTQTVEQEVQSQQSFCPVCGEPVLAGAKFCGKCGAKLE